MAGLLGLETDEDRIAQQRALVGYADDLSRQQARQEFMSALGNTWPAQLAKSAYQAVRAPGDVAFGKLDPRSDEAIKRSADFAGLMVTGGMPLAQRGALGTGGGRMVQPEQLSTQETAAFIASKYPGIKLDVSGGGDKPIVVSRIEIPKEFRNQGIGTQAMRDILDYADGTGSQVALSPSSDFGGSKQRLIEWYRSLGFVPNKGRTKDYTISESMYRMPKSAP